jgi:hypothetical protein
MPRQVYRQSAGNPVQPEHLPDEPMTIQFAHRSAQLDSANNFPFVFFKNLLLVSWICMGAEWLSHLFETGGAANFVFAVLGLRCSYELWKSPRLYQPQFALVVIPLVLYLTGIPLLPRVTFLITLAAHIGRNFARHYIYISTGYPCSREVADAIRAKWDRNTIAASLLTIPLGLLTMLPSTYFICFVAVGIVIVTCLLLATYNRISLCERLATAWRLWCTYNWNDENAPGIVQSPAGPLKVRLGSVVMLTSAVSLTFSERSGAASVVWGDLEQIFSFDFMFVSIVAVFVLVAIPVAITIGVMALVSLPAFSSIGRLDKNKVGGKVSEWETITDSIKHSQNRIERESIYLGRLTHDGSPLLVPRVVFHEHAHLLGDSGSGKTARGLIPIAEQLVADGKSSLMVIDMKGDSQEILSSLEQSARSLRKDDHPIPLKHFSVRDEHSTYAFNPFQLPCWKQLNLFQRTDVLCGALGLTYGTDYGRGFFSSANASVLHATLQNYPSVTSFSELADRIGSVTLRPKAHGLQEGQSDAGTHVKMIAERLSSFKPLNVTSQCTPDASVFKNAMDPSSLFSRQEIHYYHLSSTLGPGSSPEIARLAMFMLLTTATLAEQRRQVYLIIDEFQRVAAHNVDAILQIARSMNIGVLLANQSMLDLKRDDLQHVVEANCRFRQWFAISSPEEQERLSKASGETVDLLGGESYSRHTGALLDPQPTRTVSCNEFIAPRLTLNDIKLASDDPRKSIALVTRGAGYSQFGGMPVVVEADFHISEQEFRTRKNAPWPPVSEGTFVPRDWSPGRPVAPKKRRPNAPIVTEEIIDDSTTSSIFDRFLADQK